MKKLLIALLLCTQLIGATSTSGQNPINSSEKGLALLRSDPDGVDIPTCLTKFELQMEFCRFLLDYTLANCDAAFRTDVPALRECETITVDLYGALVTANVNALLRCQGVYN